MNVSLWVKISASDVPATPRRALASALPSSVFVIWIDMVLNSTGILALGSILVGPMLIESLGDIVRCITWVIETPCLKGTPEGT